MVTNDSKQELYNSKEGRINSMRRLNDDMTNNDTSDDERSDEETPKINQMKRMLMIRGNEIQF